MQPLQGRMEDQEAVESKNRTMLEAEVVTFALTYVMAAVVALVVDSDGDGGGGVGVVVVDGELVGEEGGSGRWWNDKIQVKYIGLRV